MENIALEEINKAFIFHQQGDSRFMRAVVFPFINEIHKNLAGSGFAESLDGFDLPSDLFSQFEGEPQGAAGTRGVIVGLTLFLGGSLGGWVLDRSYDYLFDEKIKPAVNILVEKIAKEPKQIKEKTEYCYQHGTWFEKDRVYVQLNIFVEEPRDLWELKELTIEAINRAKVIIDNKGISNKAIIFTIRNSEIYGEPIISDQLLNPIPNKPINRTENTSAQI